MGVLNIDELQLSSAYFHRNSSINLFVINCANSIFYLSNGPAEEFIYVNKYSVFLGDYFEFVILLTLCYIYCCCIANYFF